MNNEGIHLNVSQLDSYDDAVYHECIEHLFKKNIHEKPFGALPSLEHHLWLMIIYFAEAFFLKKRTLAIHRKCF